MREANVGSGDGLKMKMKMYEDALGAGLYNNRQTGVESCVQGAQK